MVRRGRRRGVQVSIAVLLENFLRACNESKLEEKVAAIKAKQARHHKCVRFVDMNHKV